MKENKTTQKVYEYIVSYQNKNGYVPSFREIASSLNIKSPSTIFYHINKLSLSGQIKKDSFKNRALQITARPVSKLREIPVVGKVAAGVPIVAIENIDYSLQLPSSMFFGKSLFALEIKGDSMINAGILNGDSIIVNQQSDAENGAIVVAMIGDDATVKRIYKEKDCIRLQPENDNYDPIYSNDVIILGKVVGLIRNI